MPLFRSGVCILVIELFLLHLNYSKVMRKTQGARGAREMRAKNRLTASHFQVTAGFSCSPRLFSTPARAFAEVWHGRGVARGCLYLV